MLIADDGKRLAPVPRRVAILGMGPTLHDFINLQLMNPGPGGVVDEVWGLNNVVSAVKCDMGFIMDDFIEMLERPYMGNKEKGIPPAVFWDATNPKLMEWCRDSDHCKIPILTSKAYRPRYPTSCTFPLKEVMQEVFGPRVGFHLSNSTSYAIAYAQYLGVQELHMYGTDFGYPADDPYDRRRVLEASRGNVESLLMMGYMAGKFTFHLSAGTSLFDTKDGRPFYGYANGLRAIDPKNQGQQREVRIGEQADVNSGPVGSNNPESRGEPVVGSPAESQTAATGEPVGGVRGEPVPVGPEQGATGGEGAGPDADAGGRCGSTSRI